MAGNQARIADGFIDHIDSQLDRHRLDRYEAGAPWLVEVVDSIDSSHISEEELRRLYVSHLVKQREGEATKGVTNLAKKMAETGQMPIDWFQYANRPIAYTAKVQMDDGNIRNKHLRVALRVATEDDFLAWARFREHEAKKNHDAEMKIVKVFRGWAHEMQLGGFRFFKDYAAAVTGTAEEFAQLQNI